jgi:hypothetical protein
MAALRVLQLRVRHLPLMTIKYLNPAEMYPELKTPPKLLAIDDSNAYIERNTLLYSQRGAKGDFLHLELSSLPLHMLATKVVLGERLS